MIVHLGSGNQIDEGVLLGYRTGRKIEASPTIIGLAARIRSGTVVYTNVQIGDHLETGHNVVIREENRLGDHVSIWNNTTIDYGCVIGNNVKIHANVYVAQFTTIEDDVFIAPGVTMANDPHPICTLCMKGPTIHRGARIGVNVTLLPLITIGEGALIGAGSVVTHDIPPGTVAFGAPARVIKTTDELECPLGIVDKPYRNGADVYTRRRRERALEIGDRR